MFDGNARWKILQKVSHGVSHGQEKVNCWNYFLHEKVYNYMGSHKNIELDKENCCNNSTQSAIKSSF